MAEKSESYVDAALAALAREARQASPRPEPELVSRVLADAGRVTAERRPARARPSRAARRRSLADLLFGWTSGAVASMAIGLAVGIGVGLEVESLPMFDGAVEDAEEVPLEDMVPPLLAMEGL